MAHGRDPKDGLVSCVTISLTPSFHEGLYGFVSEVMAEVIFTQLKKTLKAKHLIVNGFIQSNWMIFPLKFFTNLG